MSPNATRAVPARDVVRASLLAGGVFLLVFVVLTLVLLNLATPWIGDAESVLAAATRLLWLLAPVLVIDAAAALVGAYAGARSALHRSCEGYAVIVPAAAPPVLVALVLAAAGASDATQTVYDLLAVAAGSWCGTLLAVRRDEGKKLLRESPWGM